ncbi:transposase [Streptomyces sp. NPDC001792]|uniref:transposase n=1 Tax=Streptomyces sp. NPDC001792 TaxID=3154524 RepID=UPI00332BAE04
MFSEACHQRCRVHKTADAANALPTSALPGAEKALQVIGNAEDRDHALKAVTAFETTHGAKFPRAARKITADVDELPCGRPVAGR